MAGQCPQCNEPYLDGDKICWQCGCRLQDEADDNELVTAAVSPVNVSENEPAVVLGYLLLFAAVLSGALLLMGWIGRNPQVQIYPIELTDKQQIVTPLDRRFTLLMPKNWIAYEQADPAGQSGIELWQSNHPEWESWLEPLGFAADGDLVMVLEDKVGEPGTMLIWRTTTLNGMTLESAVSLIEQRQFELQDAEFIDDFHRSHQLLQIDKAGEVETRCWLLLSNPVTDSRQNESYLLVSCGPIAEMVSNGAQFTIIFNSFQQLKPN